MSYICHFLFITLKTSFVEYRYYICHKKNKKNNFGQKITVNCFREEDVSYWKNMQYSDPSILQLLLEQAIIELGGQGGVNVKR